MFKKFQIEAFYDNFITQLKAILKLVSTNLVFSHNTNAHNMIKAIVRLGVNKV
jgi:hypothetical protein